MKFTFDLDTASFSSSDGGSEHAGDIYSAESFEALSRLWVNVGWVRKFSYGFSWLGRPIIKLPEDMLRSQEAIFQTRPDVLIETGVAHGGSLIYYASLMEVLGGGRVVGVDVEIRPHNRKAIEEHPLSGRISLVEGDSVAPEIVGKVRELINPGDRVMVILDSNHTKAHVLAELEAYAPLVTSGCYLLVEDGIMKDVAGAPRTQAGWTQDNPTAAALEFVSRNGDFEIVGPPRAFDETMDAPEITYHPSGWLRRK